MTPECAKILCLQIEKTTHPAKVNFAEWLCQATKVIKIVKTNANDRTSRNVMLGRVVAILRNTFLNFYRIEFRQRPKLYVVVVDDKGEPNSKLFTRMLSLSELQIDMVIV